MLHLAPEKLNRDEGIKNLKEEVVKMKRLKTLLWYGVNAVHQASVFLFCQLIGLLTNPKEFFSKRPIN